MLNVLAIASQLFVTGPSVSKHFGSSVDFNEFHPGIGIEYNTKNFKFMGHHVFKDSRNRPLTYAGVAYVKTFNKGDWWAELGIGGGAVHRRGRLRLTPIPVVSGGYKKVGINLVYVPKGIFESRASVFIVQTKIKF
jgi:hypothetical protein